MAKKFYWLKLKDNFFNQREIKKLRKIAGGDTFVIIYLKMQLLSVKTEGKIEFEGTEDTMLDQLELELDEDRENIKLTIAYLMNNKLLELIDNDYLLPQACENIGKESDSAERVRRHREKKALLGNKKALPGNKCNVTSNTEIEIEKEKEIKKEKDSKDPVQSNAHLEFFEKVWKLYPNKKGKGKVSESKKKELHKHGEDVIVKCIERYKKDKEDWKKWQNGDTFFRNGYVDYLDENYQEVIESDYVRNDKEIDLFSNEN